MFLWEIPQVFVFFSARVLCCAVVEAVVHLHYCSSTFFQREPHIGCGIPQHKAEYPNLIKETLTLKFPVPEKVIAVFGSLLRLSFESTMTCILPGQVGLDSSFMCFDPDVTDVEGVAARLLTQTRKH